jgi:hypothetical protein
MSRQTWASDGVMRLEESLAAVEDRQTRRSAAVRRSSWSQLPTQVQTDLMSAGVPRRAPDEPLWGATRHGEPGVKGCLLGLLLIVCIGLVIAVVAVYFY